MQHSLRLISFFLNLPHNRNKKIISLRIHFPNSYREIAKNIFRVQVSYVTNSLVNTHLLNSQIFATMNCSGEIRESKDELKQVFLFLLKGFQGQTLAMILILQCCTFNIIECTFVRPFNVPKGKIVGSGYFSNYSLQFYFETKILKKEL